MKTKWSLEFKCFKIVLWITNGNRWHYMLKMFSSNTKILIIISDKSRRPFWKRKAPILYLLSIVFATFSQSNEQFKWKYIRKITTHSYQVFVLYIKRTTIAKYVSVCSNQHCFTCRNPWLVTWKIERKQTSIKTNAYSNFPCFRLPFLMNVFRIDVTPLSMHWIHIS